MANEGPDWNTEKSKGQNTKARLNAHPNPSISLPAPGARLVGTETPCGFWGETVVEVALLREGWQPEAHLFPKQDIT